MYSFGYNMFILFLKDNPKIKEQFDKYTTLDYNQEAKAYKNPEIKSYFDKLKTKAENFKTRTFHILVMPNQFIGYFITSRVEEKDNILQIPNQDDRFRIKSETPLEQFNKVFSSNFSSDSVETICSVSHACHADSPSYLDLVLRKFQIITFY